MKRLDRQEEAALVRRCAEGDAEAWSRFLSAYGPLLQALTRRKFLRTTGRAAEADVDDVVAEVLLSLLRRDRILLHRFDPQYRLSTYLGVIVRTEVLRHLRRRGRLPGGLEAAERIEDGGAGVEPEAPLLADEQREALDVLRAGLATLSERDRLLLSLKYLEGLDYKAIGAALSVNPESVGQFLTRAKARLAAAVPELEAWLRSRS